MKRFTFFLVILLAATLVSNASRAGTIRHDRSDALYQAIGALPVFDNVGRLVFSSGPDQFSCSGTLISSQWVLTAAHCVDIAESMEATLNDTTYTADMWGAHPDWLEGNFFQLIVGNDIGLVHLEEAVTDITPAQRYELLDEVGQVGVLGGYGATGTGLTGWDTVDGELRIGTNTIDGYWFGGVNSGTVLIDFDRPFTSGVTPLELLVAPGDSGGPMFLFGDEGLLLAGVNSFVLPPDLVADSDYGDIAGLTRVSPYNGWIDDVMAGVLPLERGVGAGRPLGSLLNPLQFISSAPAAVAEPGSLLLLGIGMLAVAGYRGRQRR